VADRAGEASGETFAAESWTVRGGGGEIVVNSRGNIRAETPKGKGGWDFQAERGSRLRHGKAATHSECHGRLGQRVGTERALLGRFLKRKTCGA
jgi:hypothetical protein